MASSVQHYTSSVISATSISVITRSVSWYDSDTTGSIFFTIRREKYCGNDSDASANSDVTAVVNIYSNTASRRQHIISISISITICTAAAKH